MMEISALFLGFDVFLCTFLPFSKLSVHATSPSQEPILWDRTTNVPLKNVSRYYVMLQ